jgi:predicted hydrocarbon binding protein
MTPGAISNDLRLILQESMLEILGQKDLEGVLQLTGQKYTARADKPYETSDSNFLPVVSRILETLEDKYGLNGGLGLGFRIGRNLFNQILRAKGSELGFDGNSFRLLPHSKKIRTGLKTLSEWLQDQSDQFIQIDIQAERIIWRIHRCLDCRERRSNQPICFMTAGFLHEAISWLCGGKFYKVQETECEASGQNQCSFEISLNPIQ